MKKKLLTQVLIFILLFLTWSQIISLKYTMTDGSLTGNFPVFTSIQIEMLKEEDSDLANDALKETIIGLLKFIDPAAVDYYWQGHYIFLNLIPDDNEELAIAITLPPDRGILALLQKQNNCYVLITYLDDFLPITKLDTVEMNTHDILLSEEKHNERLGAFSETTMIKLWNWHDKNLNLVWNEYSFWEINWLSTWENPKSDPVKWIKLINNAAITYHPTPKPNIYVVFKQYRYEAFSDQKTLPDDRFFDLKDSRLIKDTYYWDSNWQKFILFTGTIKKDNTATNEKVAVLKDMDHHLESFTNKNNTYQVINQHKQIKLVDKSKISVIPH